MRIWRFYSKPCQLKEKQVYQLQLAINKHLATSDFEYYEYDLVRPVMAEDATASSATAIDQCKRGLISRVEPTVKRFDAKLRVTNERQSELAERIEAENEKFSKSEEQFPMDEMIAKTKRYHDKFAALRKEMTALAERSDSMR